MKKKIIIPIILILCVLIAFLGLQLYWYHNPDIDINVAVSDSDTKQNIVLGFKEKSIWGMCDKKKFQIQEFGQRNSDLIKKVYEYPDTYYLDAGVVFEPDNCGMKIIYDGEYYADGKTESFRLEDTLPFVITYDIAYETEELLSREAALEWYKNELKNSVVNDYTCERIGFYGEFTLSIFEDGRFTYIEGGASSHIGYGNWELDGNKLTLLDVGIGEENAIKIVFEYKDKQLIYNKSESDSFIYTEPEDGTRFIPTDSMTEEQKLSLEMQLEQQLEDVNQRMITAKEDEEERLNAKLYAVVRQNFIGEDFEGFVCFDARETIEDEHMPIKLWVETRDKQILWETELGLPHTSWNSYYMYEEDGKNYLIQYYPDDSQGMIAFRFNMFTVHANGELIETDTFEANSKEEIQDFNINVMPYLNEAELLVGTIGGDINVKD